MNLKRLKEAEQAFLAKYPGGFEHPAMIEVARKHKKDLMIRLALERFAKANFKNPAEIVESTIKTVTQSSLVSVFEKPRFRDIARSFSKAEQVVFTTGLKYLLHGNQQRGFEACLSVLTEHKLAKWTLITVIPAYYKPEFEVFIKPTTTRKIIDNLDLDLSYNATPRWEFYEAYRDAINTMKTKVSQSLAPSNTAFCGFLMMSFD